MEIWSHIKRYVKLHKHEVIYAALFAVLIEVIIKWIEEHPKGLYSFNEFVYATFRSLYKKPLLYILFILFFSLFSRTSIRKLFSQTIERIVPNKFCVGISYFEHTGKLAEKINKKLIHDIRKKLSATDIKCVIFHEVVNDHNKAKELGEKKNVHIFLWGLITELGNQISIDPEIQIIKSLGKTEFECPQLPILVEQISLTPIVVTRIADDINDAIFFILGFARYNSRKYEKAIESFEKIHLKKEAVLLYMGNSYFLSSNPEFNVAENLYRKALEQNAELAEVHYNLGCLLCNKGKYGKAKSEFEKTLRIDPNFAEAYNNIVALLIKQNKFDEAEKKLRKALSMKPTLIRAHCNLGISLMKQNRYEEAENALRQAIRMNPKYAEAHFELWNLFYILNRFDNAENEYRIALRINPALKAAHTHLGDLYPIFLRYDKGETKYTSMFYSAGMRMLYKAEKSAGMHMLSSGAEYFTIDLEFLPVEITNIRENLKKLKLRLLVWFWFQRGLVLERQNRYDEAILYFERVKKIDKRNAELFCHLGDCNRLNSECAKAIECYKMVIELDPAIDVWYHLSFCQRMIANQVHCP